MFHLHAMDVFGKFEKGIVQRVSLMADSHLLQP